MIPFVQNSEVGKTNVLLTEIRLMPGSGDQRNWKEARGASGGDGCALITADRKAHFTAQHLTARKPHLQEKVTLSLRRRTTDSHMTASQVNVFYLHAWTLCYLWDWSSLWSLLWAGNTYTLTSILSHGRCRLLLCILSSLKYFSNATYYIHAHASALSRPPTPEGHNGTHIGMFPGTSLNVLGAGICL